MIEQAKQVAARLRSTPFGHYLMGDAADTIEQLCAALEAAQVELAIKDSEIKYANAEALTYRKELEASQRDAERYRWLKVNIQDGYSFGRGYYLSDESIGWDATIDAAIAAQGAKHD